jgi:hypothetical protein
MLRNKNSPVRKCATPWLVVVAGIVLPVKVVIPANAMVVLVTWDR